MLEGDPCFKLARKLKLLKEDLKVWNREVFGKLKVRINSLAEEIRKLDKKVGTGGLSDEEEIHKVDLKRELGRLLTCEKISWKQKSRI